MGYAWDEPLEHIRYGSGGRQPVPDAGPLVADGMTPYPQGYSPGVPSGYQQVESGQDGDGDGADVGYRSDDGLADATDLGYHHSGYPMSGFPHSVRGSRDAPEIHVHGHIAGRDAQVVGPDGGHQHPHSHWGDNDHGHPHFYEQRHGDHDEADGDGQPRNTDGLYAEPPYDVQPGAMSGKHVAVTYQTSSSSGRGPWTPRARMGVLRGEHEIAELTMLADRLENEIRQARNQSDERLFYRLVEEKDALLQRRSQLEYEHETAGHGQIERAEELTADLDDQMQQARMRGDEPAFYRLRAHYDEAMARRSALLDEYRPDGDGIAGPSMRASALLGGHTEDLAGAGWQGEYEGYGEYEGVMRLRSRQDFEPDGPIVTRPPSSRSRYSDAYNWTRDATYHEDGIR